MGGGHGELWAPRCARLCCSPCCQPVPAPQQKHQKKKSLWANQEIFFLTDDEMSKGSRMFPFALSRHFIPFGLFNNL